MIYLSFGFEVKSLSGFDCFGLEALGVRFVVWVSGLQVPQLVDRPGLGGRFDLIGSVGFGLFGFGGWGLRLCVLSWRFGVWGWRYSRLYIADLQEAGVVFFLRLRNLSYRGTSLIRNTPLLGPYSRTVPRVLWWSKGGGAVSYKRGTPTSAFLVWGFMERRYIYIYVNICVYIYTYTFI